MNIERILQVALPASLSLIGNRPYRLLQAQARANAADYIAWLMDTEVQNAVPITWTARDEERSESDKIALAKSLLEDAISALDHMRVEYEQRRMAQLNANIHAQQQVLWNQQPIGDWNMPQQVAIAQDTSLDDVCDVDFS